VGLKQLKIVEQFRTEVYFIQKGIRTNIYLSNSKSGVGKDCERKGYF